MGPELPPEYSCGPPFPESPGSPPQGVCSTTLTLRRRRTGASPPTELDNRILESPAALRLAALVPVDRRGVKAQSFHRHENCRAAAEPRQAPPRIGRRRKRSAGSPVSDAPPVAAEVSTQD